MRCADFSFRGCVLSFMVAVLLAVLFCVIGGHEAAAVPAYPGLVEVTQPDGSAFSVRLQGDEFFSWHETPEGFAVKKGADGVWKYARPAEAALAFEALPDAVVGKADPRALGLSPKAGPPAELLRGKILPKLKARRGGVVEGEPATLAARSSAIPDVVEEPAKKIPVAGVKTVKNVVILAAFNDHWDSGAGTVSSTYGRTNVTEYTHLFNEVNHSNDGAQGSVRDYFNEVSYGNLTVESIIVPWVRLDNNMAYYGANDAVYDDDLAVREMVEEAVDKAEAAGFDFSQGDSDGDGWVDCLTILHSGHGEEYGSNSPDNVWSQQWAMTTVKSYDGVSMRRFHTEPALRDGDPASASPSTGIIRIGVICHEMGHFFGLPDLYDYSNLTLGIGKWGIMASGSWNGSNGTLPAHYCGWSKINLGFIAPTIVHSKEGLTLPRIEDNPVTHMVLDGAGSGEYFLVENRVRHGFDNTADIFPGILIYHIDDNNGNNDFNTWPHPVVKIEEADGNDSLGMSNSSSEAGDVWNDGSGLAGGFKDQTGDSTTNAMLYQSGSYYTRSDNPADYTYIRMSNFSAPGDTMTYDLQTLVPSITQKTGLSSDYSVQWAASSEATRYEIDEGESVVQTSLGDGAESEADMFRKWVVAGTVQRSSEGARTGSYSYVLQNFNDAANKWYPSIQSLTSQQTFVINPSSVLSFYYMSQLSAGAGYLKCQVSNDGGDNWVTLGTFGGRMDSWTQVTYTFTDFSNAGFSEGDACQVKFITNTERTLGYSDFPSYGFAIDDISLTDIAIDTYGNWTTLDSNVTATSYSVTGKVDGSYVYRVRAYANGVWQNYSDATLYGVGGPYTVSFITDGTPGATLTGVTSQTVTLLEDCSPVRAIEPDGYEFKKWVLTGSGDYSTANPLTVRDVTSSMELEAVFKKIPTGAGYWEILE